MKQRKINEGRREKGYVNEEERMKERQREGKKERNIFLHPVASSALFFKFKISEEFKNREIGKRIKQ